MNASQARSLLVLLVVYLTLLAMMKIAGDCYGALWLPLLRSELSWLLPAGTLIDVSIAMRAGEQVYLAQVALESVPVGSSGSGVSGIVTVSALSGNVVQPLVIVLTLVLSNAKLNTRQKCLALCGATVVLVLLVSVDVPLVMRGAMNELLCDHEATDCLGASLLARYGSALDRGGRLALAVLAGWALIESVAARK